MDNNIAKKVLEKIKAAGAKPKPKWFFWLKNFMLWLFFGATLIIGSLATAVIILMIKNSDWDLYGRFGEQFQLIKNLPYFWFIILIIFIFLAYFDYRQTKGGYRHQFYLIIIASIVISIVFGVIFYNLGFGQKMEYHMQKKLPFYKEIFTDKFLDRQGAMWSQPEKGLLVGKVVSIHSVDNFKLEDLEKRIWTVFNNEGIYYKHPLELEIGLNLKVLGERLDGGNFKAEEIRPFMNPGLTPPPPLIKDMKERMFFIRIK